MAADLRVILHVDMDCFYAQVEQNRLGIPRDTPCAVQQWDGLIAVNYAARAQGVTRHMRVRDAVAKCPGLQLVHVETIKGGIDESEEQQPVDNANNDVDDNTSNLGKETAAAREIDNDPSSKRWSEKVSLERYRNASAKIRALVHRLVPTATLEKVGTDEFFFDVTSIVDNKLSAEDGSIHEGGVAENFSWGSIIPNGPLSAGDLVERRLAEGAAIACRIRGALLSELQFTSSAGISFNKLLAKLGSGLNKPNQQTIIAPKAVTPIMQDLPLTKLWGFGGKLGQQLEDIGITTAGQVKQLSNLQDMERHIGIEKTKWVIAAANGQNYDAVKAREAPASLLSAKSMNPTTDIKELQKWMRILASEIASRCSNVELEYRRKANTLTVQYRGGKNGTTQRSKSFPMPRNSGKEKTIATQADTIYHATWQAFQSACLPEALPCNRLALTANNFSDMHEQGTGSIEQFLKPRAQKRQNEDEVATIDETRNEGNPESDISKQPETSDQAPAASNKDIASKPAVAGFDTNELGVEITDADIAEQKRILKEIEMMQKLQNHRATAPPVAKKSKKSNDEGKNGSKSILDFMKK